MGRYKKVSNEISHAIRNDIFSTVVDKSVSLAANIVGVGMMYDLIKSCAVGYKEYKSTGSWEKALTKAGLSFTKAGIASQAADITVLAMGGKYLSSSKYETARKVASWAMEETYSKLLGD